MLDAEKKLVDDKILALFKDTGDLQMYHMLRYFMGYENKLKNPSDGKHGKRNRSALLLMVADMFGGGESALELAAAIELFHNFTLIHDDIVDNDEMRRGQPTVWKVWGIDHAINSGDAQLLLTNRCLLKAAEADSVNGTKAGQLLNNYFLEVCEGQYLDFELTKKKLGDKAVTEEAYFEMIRKKTAVLVGSATAAGGQSAGAGPQTVRSLYMYGESLGLAYQLVDDLVSVWNESEETGKRAYGDMYERKKTYPVLYTLQNGDKDELLNIYDKEGDITESEIKKAIALFEDAGAKEATEKQIETYIDKSRKNAENLPLGDREKEKLISIVEKVAKTAGTIAKNTV